MKKVFVQFLKYLQVRYQTVAFRDLVCAEISCIEKKTTKNSE